ncbi:MAG TPA: hypothetical protein VL309_11615 [Vicinamibacterales bacterium]|jgi:hypothetical protein|nr:hypothetical protein [Vicinamibacterales bacterium]
MKAVALGCLAAIAGLAMPPAALAQDSKSAPLAHQLSSALDAAKLDSLATRDPANADTFVAALYFPGLQLLVVSAKYSAPQLIDVKLAQKNYKDIYIDLNSASVPESKVFVEDLGADGLKAKRDENQPFDSYEAAGKRTAFDSDWKRQKLSEDEYKKAFTSADDRYSQLLTALLAQLKKTS